MRTWSLLSVQSSLKQKTQVTQMTQDLRSTQEAFISSKIQRVQIFKCLGTDILNRRRHSS
jgi:hypothetical protein